MGNNRQVMRYRQRELKEVMLEAGLEPVRVKELLSFTRICSESLLGNGKMFGELEIKDFNGLTVDEVKVNFETLRLLKIVFKYKISGNEVWFKPNGKYISIFSSRVYGRKR